MFCFAVPYLSLNFRFLSGENTGVNFPARTRRKNLLPPPPPRRNRFCPEDWENSFNFKNFVVFYSYRQERRNEISSSFYLKSKYQILFTAALNQLITSTWTSPTFFFPENKKKNSFFAPSIHLRTNVPSPPFPCPSFPRFSFFYFFLALFYVFKNFLRNFDSRFDAFGHNKGRN